MTERLFRVGRYMALLCDHGERDDNPAIAQLADLLEEYLDGGDFDAPAVDVAIARIGEAARADIWATAADNSVVRRARVVPGALEIKFVVAQLRKP